MDMLVDMKRQRAVALEQGDVLLLRLERVEPAQHGHEPLERTAFAHRQQALILGCGGKFVQIGQQLRLGVGEQERQCLEGLHCPASVGCLTPWRCLGLPNKPTSLAPPEQPLPKLKPQELLRSKAFSAYSRCVVGMTKRSS